MASNLIAGRGDPKEQAELSAPGGPWIIVQRRWKVAPIARFCASVQLSAASSSAELNAHRWHTTKSAANQDIRKVHTE